MINLLFIYSFSLLDVAVGIGIGSVVGSGLDIYRLVTLLANFDGALVAKLIIFVYDIGAAGAAEAVAATHAVEDRLAVLHPILLHVHMVLIELSTTLRVLARKRQMRWYKMLWPLVNL